MVRPIYTQSLYTPGLISLLLPTRGRRKIANRFLESVADRTARRDKVEVILYIDEDDRDSHQLSHSQLSINKIIGPQKTMGGYNTACLKLAKGEIVILANDDVVIRTDGWDERIRSIHKSIPDGIYLAYCNDLFKGENLCAFPILSRRTCDLLGDPFPLLYHGAFIDMHIFDIFKRLAKKGHHRIRYLRDTVFEHCHYRAGKAELDTTYLRRSRFQDDGTFLALKKVRNNAAHKLAEEICGRHYAIADTEAEDIRLPGNVVSAFASYGKYFLLDPGLPWRWKAWLWFWYCGRFLAAKGWLRFPNISGEKRNIVPKE